MPESATDEPAASAGILNQSSGARLREQRIAPLISAVLAGGTFALFFHALGGEILIWDDEINLWHTPQIRTLDFSSLVWMFTDTEQALRYKPLCWMIWAGMMHLFGESSLFRLPNLLFHAFNSALVFLLLIGFNRRPDRRSGIRDYALAGGLAAFWAWAPARIEPATWISGLGYPLALSFSLLSALVFRQALSQTSIKLRRRTLALSLFFWILGLLSYPSALCLLPLFPVLTLTANQTRSIRQAIKSSSGHLLLGGLLTVSTLATRLFSHGVWGQSALSAISPSEQIGRAAYFPLWVLGRMNPFSAVGPIHDSMTRPTLQDPLVWAGILLVILISALLLRARNKVQTVLWVSFLVALIPHVGFTEALFLPTDRYTYTASIYLLPILGSLILRLSSRTQNTIITAIAAVVIVTVPLTWSQAGIWKTNQALFHRAYEQVQTDLFRAEVFLRIGRLEQAKGNLDHARDLFTQSANYAPRDPRPHTHLAKIFTDQRRLEEAAEQYEILLDLDPDDYTAKNNFGLILIKMERPADAVVVLEKAAARDPSPTTLTNLAYAYAESGALAKAQRLLTPEICAVWQPAERLRLSLQSSARPSR